MRRGRAKTAVAVLLVLGLALLAATYGGPWHPAGDSLSVGRPYLAALLLALGLLWRGRVGWLAVAGGVVALAPMVWAAAVADRPTAGVTIYQKNLLFALPDPSAIIADIRSAAPDVVLLAELGNRNLAIPQALTDILPHQAICPAHAVGAVAILSRWPMVDEDCRKGQGAVAARVVTPGGPLTVAALHLHWPWPFGQAAQVDRLLPWLEALPRPAVVGGDFNSVPAAQVVRHIADATGTRRAGPLRPSFFLKSVLPVTIDHVLTPAGLRARSEMRPDLGSDHRGQIVTLEMAP